MSAADEQAELMDEKGNVVGVFRPSNPASELVDIVDDAGNTIAIVTRRGECRAKKQ